MRKERNFDQLMISFSGGRSSAMMLYKMIEDGSAQNAVVCFANTGKERNETLDFVQKCDEEWGGGNMIKWLEFDLDTKFRLVNWETASRDGKPFSELIGKKKYPPNVVTRFCTQELKIRVIKNYMLSLGFNNWTSVLGIRLDEPNRYFRGLEAAKKDRWEVSMPMYSKYFIKKEDVDIFWKKQPFDLQLKSYEGNCDLCFLKGVNKLKRIMKENPESYKWWSLQEKNNTFIKGISYSTLNQKAQSSLNLPYDDSDDFQCFCNID